MKKYRWTALLLALVLAAGVCAGCGKKQTDAPAQDNQIQTNPDEVTAVTYTNGTITLRFSLQDGRWCWSDDKTFPLDGSYITALLADVQGGPPISITEEDLESYGLGGVTKYIEITTEEKTVTYYLGDPCDDGSSYLSRDDDESTVYRAPDDLSARRHDCGKRRRAHLHGGRRCLDGGRRGRVSGDGVPRGRTLAAGVLRLRRLPPRQRRRRHLRP